MNKRAILLSGQDRDDALHILFSRPGFIKKRNAKWYSIKDKLFRRLEREFPEMQEYEYRVTGTRNGLICVVLGEKKDTREETKE